MSGGSYDYFCWKLEQFAGDLRSRANDTHTPEHRAARLLFADHMEQAAKAAHDIEWVDSGDYGTGQEMEALNKYFALHGDVKGYARADLAQHLRKVADMLEANP